MQDLFVSIDSNKLRVSTVSPKIGFRSAVEDLTENVISDYKIVDKVTFASVLGETISKVTKQPANRLLLNFILEPQDVILRFFTLSKGLNGDEEQIISEIKKKVSDVDLQDLYFSYQKIAPFLYQFIGVRKDTMENYLEISNSVGIGLKSVIPWVVLLPKYTESTLPTIFVVRRGRKQVIALSELNGIFYTGVYEKERSSVELNGFIKQLSFYNRSEPVKTLYTLNYDTFSMSGFEINKITLPVAELDSESTEGFEINILTNFMLDKEPMIISGQGNAVNLLPTPAVVKKTPVMVYVGSAVVGLVLVGALAFFGILKRPAASEKNLAQNGNPDQNVLSETKSSTESNGSVAGQGAAELQRSDLKIRVENGTGVSGLAAKTRDLLKGLGYNLGEGDKNIGTAQEERKDTLLRFNKAKVSYKDIVVADIKDKFQDMVVEDNLKDGLEYDLLVIIGGNANL
jgi:hypothetical protein